jgi:hypothetical protein
MSQTSNSRSESMSATVTISSEGVVPPNSMAMPSKSQNEIPRIQVVPEPTPARSERHLDRPSSPSDSHTPLQDSDHSSRVDSRSTVSGKSETDPELAGLDALEDGRPGERPAYPFTTLIRSVISCATSLKYFNLVLQK